MSEPVWVRPDVLVRLHNEELSMSGGGSGVRDPAGLEVALVHPRPKYANGEGDLTVLAAAYAYAIASSHPFVAGNKRVAYLAMEVFLLANGVVFEPDDVDAVLTFEGLAAGAVSEPALAEWIRGNSA